MGEKRLQETVMDNKNHKPINFCDRYRKKYRRKIFNLYGSVYSLDLEKLKGSYWGLVVNRYGVVFAIDRKYSVSTINGKNYITDENNEPIYDYFGLVIGNIKDKLNICQLEEDENGEILHPKIDPDRVWLF